MARTLFATLALAGAAVAASASTSVTSILLFGDDQPLAASIVRADKTATVYDIQCIDPQTCGLPVGATITQGPSTWAFTMVFPESPVATLSASCSLDIPHDSAVCTTIIPPGLNDPPGKTVVTETSLKTDFNVITITAGLEKLAAAGSGSGSSAAAPTSAGGSQSSAAAGSQSGGDAKQTGSSSSKNAAPMATKPAALMAGVAAVVGALAL